MYPAPIDSYSAPSTLNEALAALEQHGDEACVIAGGMSVMQAIKARLLQPRHIIDLKRITELKGVAVTDDGVAIGAMTRYRDIATEPHLKGAYQALADAAATVGDRQVRNRGTIGGSLCWNYIAACTPPTVLTLGGRIELHKADGTSRVVPADEFLIAPLETARADDEVLTRVLLPPPPAHAGSAYRKFATLTDGLPVVGVAAYIETDSHGACTAARLGIGGILPRCRRATAGEAALKGVHAEDAAAIDAALDAAGAEVEPQDDRWASADYRKIQIRSLGRAVVASAFARAASG